MRTDTFGFFEKNIAASKDSRFVIEVAFDSANSVLRYFGSHDDCDYPASSTVYDGVITDFSSTSQKLDPISGNSTIGDISFDVLDDGSDITELLAAQLVLDRSLRKNRVRVYAGYKGLAWSDYTLLTTQFVDDSVSYKDGVYTINCSDIQRETRTKIFKPYTTNLNAALTKTDTTLTVVSNANFTMVAHDASYSLNASATVGYLKIYKSGDEYEIVSYTGKSSTTGFTGLTRALFGTKAMDVTIDSGLATDRRPKVEEYIYIEGPAPKVIYALRTGVLYDQGGATLPSHWHVGTSTSYVRLADFTNYGADWWDTTDNTKGFKVRFQGLQETDGKQFIERELQLLLGAFGPIYSDGAVGLRKMAGVLSNAGAVAHLTASNIVSYGDLKHDYKRLHNDIEVHWNYDELTKTYTRINEFIDTDSQTIYGTSDKYILKFQGLIGDIHTTSMLLNQFAAIRDRYSGPPLSLTLNVLPSLNHIEVGDVVRVTLDQIRDYTGSATTIDRTFEIQSIRINWIAGTVSLDLFGSSKLAKWVPLDATTGSVITDAYYTSAGTNLTTPLTISGGAVTANGSLTGNAVSTSARYYYNGDLTINDGVTVTGTQNLFLVIKGYLTINGTLTLAGGGAAGTAGAVTVGTPATYDGTAGTATAGMVGATYSQGYLNRSSDPIYIVAGAGTTTAAAAGTLPPTVNVRWNGSTLTGIPTELRGVSGGCGGALLYSTGIASHTGSVYDAVAGGAGGAGGGGLVILCRGLAFGVNGKIVLSGADGTAGTATVVESRTYYSGSGAGGAPGYLCVIIDGNNITYPDLTSSTYVAANGATPVIGQQTVKNVIGKSDGKGPFCSAYIGGTAYGAEAGTDAYVAPDASGLSSWSRVVYVESTGTAVADPKLIADVPTAVAAVEATNTPQTPAENLATVTVTVTPPSDGNYLYSNVYYRVTGTTPWTLAGPANNTRTIVAAMDGTTYDVEARSVSRLGGESPTGARTTVAMTSGPGGVSLANGNYFAINKTSYADTSDGAWIGKSAGAVTQVYFGDASSYMKWTAAAGAVISGNVTATTGAIGGWTLGATTLTGGGLVLDSGNTRIRATSGSSYIEHSATSLKGYSDSLGRTTFEVPANGDPPSFSDAHVTYITSQEMSAYTSGSHLTAAASAADTTLNLKDTSTFGASGTGWIVDSTNTNDIFTWTGKTSTTLTGCSGVLAHNSGAIVLPGKAFVQSSATDETSWHGTDGVMYGSVGVNTNPYSADSVIASFGNFNSGSYGSTLMGVQGMSYSNAGVKGISTTYIGVAGLSTDFFGIYGTSVNSYSGYFACPNPASGKAPIQLQPSSSASAPTHSADIGALWVTSDGVLYINTSGSTTWTKVGAQ